MPPRCRRCPAPTSALLLPPSCRHHHCCAAACRHCSAIADAVDPPLLLCCYRCLCPAAAAAAAAAATAVAFAVTIAVTIPIAIDIVIAVTVAVALLSPLLSPSLSPKECTIHAAMERLLNGSRVGVNIATGPRGATDLNAIEEHRAKPIVFHPNKSSCENTAIGQGRTIGRKCSNHHVVRHDMDQKYICRFLSFWSCPVFFFAGQIWT